MVENIDLVIRKKTYLVEQGIKKLKIIGFTNVTKDNILTDEIYQLYFLGFINSLPVYKKQDEIKAIDELRSHLHNALRS